MEGPASSEPAPLVEGEAEGLRPAPTVDSLGSYGLGSASRREPFVYLPRERKCPKFSGLGTSAGALTVEEWLEEAQGCIRSRYLSEWDKAMFLYDHLEGQARNEIKYRSQEVWLMMPEIPVQRTAVNFRFSSFLCLVPPPSLLREL
ncbi:hypothetical protein MHYP_G00339590 [Metynnis hypsauchen]